MPPGGKIRRKACLVLAKEPAAQTTQADDKTAAEKASADTDEALDKRRMKSIYRDC